MNIDINFDNLKYDEINNTETREKIKTELWNNIVFSEFNKIYESIKPSEKDSQVQETLAVSKAANKAGLIWNKKFKGYFFYKNNIYFIELCYGLSMPDLYFRQYNIESFFKGINYLHKKNARILKIYKLFFCLFLSIIFLLIIFWLLKNNL